MKWKAILVVVMTSLFLSTGTGLSGYAIPTSATTEGGGISAAQQYEMTFIIGQACPVGTSSNPTYSLSSGLVSMLLDVHPPAIVHTPVLVAPARTALVLDADVIDDRTGVGAVTIFYHEGGRLGFRQKDMEYAGGSFTGSLPPSAITEKGLVYYLKAADNAGNTSLYPEGAPDSVIVPRVYFQDLQSGFEMPAARYRMISLPGSTNGDPDTVLLDDLGVYGKPAWRLGRWNSSPGCEAECYEEYPEIDDFAPGRAFWLISKKATRFDFSGTSLDITRPFAVHLDRGWNQISTPFAFTTDWLSTLILFQDGTYALDAEHIVGTDTVHVEDNLVSYDDTYHGHQSELEPWRGYWIYNGSTSEVDLLLHPEAIIPVLGRPAHDRDGMDLLLALEVSSEDFGKRRSLVGLSPRARDGWDPMDHREPPTIGDYLRVIFERPSWGRYSGTYMSDVRTSNQNGGYWEFCIEASKAQAVTLETESLIEIRAGWELYIYDVETGIKLSASDLPYNFRLDGSRRLALIAGTQDFIANQESEGGIHLAARIVGVHPNPFEQSVRVSYFVPRPEHIRLDVFSVEGRHIVTLADAYMEGGLRTITWRGESKHGGRVAPGIYLLRYESEESVQTAKILRIR